jgi:hypothetical protein
MSDKPAVRELAPLMAQASPEEGVRLLAGLSANDAFNLVLEHPDPSEVVALTPAPSLYLMMHEIGSDDALTLLELAAPPQVQSFLDMDCWNRDRLDIPKARTWFLLLNELDDEAFMRHIAELDLSFLVTFFAAHLNIHLLDNPDDEFEIDGITTVMADNRRLIQYTCGHEHSRLINALLVRLSHGDLAFFQNLLDAIYWEAGAPTEEAAYEERVSRMDTHGFPDYYAAIEILTTVDVERFVPQRKVASSPLSQAPGAAVSGSQYLVKYEHPDSLLRRALAGSFPGREELAVEIMGLANMATVAAAAPFFELDNVRRLVARTDGYISIGLERIGGDDAEKARELLTTLRVIDLHKIGRSLVMEQAKRARRLLPRIAADRKSINQLLLDGREGDLVAGLLRAEPTRREGGEDLLWTSLEQVNAARETLDAVERLVALMEDELKLTPAAIKELPLAGCNLSEPAVLSYRVLVNTLRCLDLLGRATPLTPLAPDDLQSLYAAVTKQAGVAAWPADSTEAFAAWLRAKVGEDAASALQAIFDRWSAALTAELARREIEPRFRHEVVVRLA